MHREVEQACVAFDAHHDALGRAMARGVVDRLLGDAVAGIFERGRRAWVVEAFELADDLDTGGTALPLREPAQGLGEAQLVELRGTQLMRDAAQLLEGGVGGLDAVGEERRVGAVRRCPRRCRPILSAARFCPTSSCSSLEIERRSSSWMARTRLDSTWSRWFAFARVACAIMRGR
jgi:hypothetical protein